MNINLQKDMANIVINLKNNCTLREYRFLIIYLSKINKLKPDINTIKFSFEEFTELCGIKEERNIQAIKKIMEKLISNFIIIETEESCKHISLFSECSIDKDLENGGWYFTLSVSPEKMPLFFELKSYFTLELQYALKLKSSNQIRLYELLKQNEKKVHFDIKLDELRKIIGILPEEYPENKFLKQNVLDVCKKAINELTDITFTYEPKKRVGKGGRISELTFCILSKSKEKKPKKDPLWIYALDIATRRNNKKKLSVTPERYAIGILNNWKEAGLNTTDDLIAVGEINKQTVKDLEEPEFPESAYNLKDF